MTTSFPRFLRLTATALSAAAAFSAQAQNIRLMPLGDSITYGEQSSTGVGYRGPLWNLMTGHFTQLDFVGAQQHGSMVDPDNEGHSGWRIDSIANIATGEVNEYRPNVVTLHLGTNDVVQNYQMGTAPDRLAALIDQIFVAAPDVTLLVSSIVPSADAGREALTATFNAALPGIVQARASAGKHIVFVDMSAVTVGDLAPDGIHPQDSGYAKMATAWWGGLQQAIGAGWIKDPVTLFGGKFELQNTGSQLALGVAGGSKKPDAAVVQAPFDADKSEFWTFVPADQGYYHLRNVKSGLALNVAGASKDVGARIVQWPAQAAPSAGNDLWKPVHNGDGSYTFLNLNSQLALDVPGGVATAQTPLDQATPNDTAAQKFKLRPKGVVSLVGVQSGRCLDNTNTANGAAVLLWDCSAGTNQQWVPKANGTLAAAYGKCLEVFDNATTAGAKVGLHDCNGAPNQRWKLNADGSIAGVPSGLCLDAAGAATANGTPVQVWTCNGGPNQQWTKQP